MFPTNLIRGMIALVALLVTVASLDTVTVFAASSKNPFSSYNISGVNYGAQQWERTHGKSSSGANSGRSHARRSRR